MIDLKSEQLDKMLTKGTNTKKYQKYKQRYFTSEDIRDFTEYINATTSTKKEKIYNKYLYPFITRQIEYVLKSNNKCHNDFIMNNYDDLLQEINVYIYIRIIPNLDINKIKGIQNLIYITAKNKLVDIYRESTKKKNIIIDYNDYNINNEKQIIEDVEMNHTAIIELINSKIDESINNQTSINTVNSVYLQLLKNYIIDNDYNSQGFKKYCMNKMNIGVSQFLNISYSLGFRTLAFKDKNN